MFMGREIEIWKRDGNWWGGTCNDCNDKTNSKFTVQKTGKG